MTIAKHGKGWRVFVDIGINPIGGGRDRLTKVVGTLKEAQRVERDYLRRKDSLNGISDRVTFAEFLEFVYWPSKSNLRQSTLDGYMRDIKLRLMPAFGHLNLCDINRLKIQAMINQCPTHKAAENARCTLRAILREALELEIIRTNPASGRFKLPDIITNKRDTKNGVWLTSYDEHKELLSSCVDTQVEAIIILGLCFGLRKGEIFGMDWADIDFKNNEITVNKTYTMGKGGPVLTPPKTRESQRTIPGPQYAFTRLQAIRREGNVIKMGPVLVGASGDRMSPASASKLLHRHIKNTECANVTAMSLRHSFATTALRAGMPVASVSRWLGHTDITTTLNRYVKPLLSNLHEDVSIIDAGYSKLDSEIAQAKISNGT